VNEDDLLSRLGRLPSSDARDKNFPMSAAFAAVPTPTRRYWSLGEILDQGRTSMCVGFAARQLLASSPHRYRAAAPTPQEIYRNAQLLDEWSGENYDGTSARGAMKYLAAQGIVSTYRWATTPDEIMQFVLTTGPVLLGINWHASMFFPTKAGFLVPDGNVVGGHEVLIYGVNRATGVWSLANSWGSWGPLRGRFRLAGADFNALFADGGDACVASEA